MSRDEVIAAFHGDPGLICALPLRCSACRELVGSIWYPPAGHPTVGLLAVVTVVTRIQTFDEDTSSAIAWSRPEHDERSRWWPWGWRKDARFTFRPEHTAGACDCGREFVVSWSQVDTAIRRRMSDTRV